ncbi:hypothetical protein BDV96DRAFT_647472 [Lophiotrema nucula]|uniref:Uncharacterized protein n=1 Tax=Lophiotrema nucula TaxID=690887 RepID=A0A6A5Z3I4_9PLEO|nr:hypothetical protein BDV96DRAFT_647472 [Lophiotrema nucula]
MVAAFSTLNATLVNIKQDQTILPDWSGPQIQAYSNGYHNLSLSRDLFLASVEECLLPLVVSKKEEQSSLMSGSGAINWADESSDLRLCKHLGKNYKVVWDLATQMSTVLVNIGKVMRVNVSPSWIPDEKLSPVELEKERLKVNFEKDLQPKQFDDLNGLIHRMRKLLEAEDVVQSTSPTQKLDKASCIDKTTIYREG